jgi:hypothetical protein
MLTLNAELVGGVKNEAAVPRRTPVTLSSQHCSVSWALSSPHTLARPSDGILKRASASRSSGEWNDNDFDVLADGAVVGRIFPAGAAPVAPPWMWTLLYGYREDARGMGWLCPPALSDI